MVTPNSRVAQLPNQIPPQSAPAMMTDGGGNLVFETNWWLFFYNIASQVLSLSGGTIVLPDAVVLSMLDSEVDESDSVRFHREFVNAVLQLPDQDVVPSLQQVNAALILAQDALLQDSVARAQPVASVTVGASPFTFTALSNGVLAVSVGTVSAISLIRQGVSVATGQVAGLIPVSRLDQVQITYAVAPTVAFLPS